MLAFAFNELDLYRVSGRCMTKNTASCRVMEKLGFCMRAPAGANC